MSEPAAVRWVRVKDSCLRESYGSLKYPEPAAGRVARVRLIVLICSVHTRANFPVCPAVCRTGLTYIASLHLYPCLTQFVHHG